MAITLPLALPVFADRLRVLQSGGFEISRFEETSGTARGEVLVSEIAAPKWRYDGSLAAMRVDCAHPILALLQRLGNTGTFYLYDLAQPYPRADPGGTILGASTPTIHTASGGRALRIAGLPAGYVLSAGDMLAFDRGSDPVRRSLHRIVENATASGAGLTPLFEVEPQLKTGTVTGLAVLLGKPAAKMQMVGFSQGVRRRQGPIEGMSFTAIEAF